MIVLYGCTFIISAILFAFCLIKYNKTDIHLVWLFMSVVITNLGYLLISISKSVTFALISNSIAYLGSIFLIAFSIVLIIKTNNLIVKKSIKIVLSIISLAVYFLTISPFFSTVYYKSVKLSQIGNATILVKSYGVLHPIYKIYVILSIIVMLSIISVCFIRNIKDNLYISMFLTFIIMVNVAVWIAENFLHFHFEIMSISYLATEIFILLLHKIIKELVDKSNNQLLEIKTLNEQSKIITDDNIDFFLNKIATNILTNREIDVFRLLVKGVKRKDIADQLYITESTVKKHSANIYKKFEVTNREELQEKIKQNNN